MTLNQRRSAGENRFHLHMTVTFSLPGKFSEILQRGFSFKTRVGISIGSFFRDDLALSPQVLQKRISTVFLDGRVVDSLETALLRQGSTLALSSAMPGLAGATLRREGPYASLRASISYVRQEPGYVPVEEGMIRVKLFNLLLEELGPLFLEKGILVKSPELLDFFVKQKEEFRRGCGSILLNGEDVDYGGLLSRNVWTENRDVELTVVKE